MQPNDPRGIPEVVSDTLDKATTLVTRELEVLKREMAAEVQKAARGAKLLGTAGVAGLVAAIFGSLTVFFILDLFTWQWVAALIVTVVWAIVAAVSASRGKEELERIDPVPRATLQGVRRDTQTLRSSVERDMPVIREDAKVRAQDAYDKAYQKTPDSVKEKITELKDKAVDKMPADVAEKLPSKVTKQDPVLDAKAQAEKRRREAERGDDETYTSDTVGTYTYGGLAGGAVAGAALTDPEPFTPDPTPEPERPAYTDLTPTPVVDLTPTYTPPPTYDPPSTSSGSSGYDSGSSGGYSSGGSSDSGSSSSSDSGSSY